MRERAPPYRDGFIPSSVCHKEEHISLNRSGRIYDSYFFPAAYRGIKRPQKKTPSNKPLTNAANISVSMADASVKQRKSALD